MIPFFFVSRGVEFDRNAALVAAGLLSVLVFPLIALGVTRTGRTQAQPTCQAKGVPYVTPTCEHDRSPTVSR